MIKYNNNTVNKFAMDSTVNKIYVGGNLAYIGVQGESPTPPTPVFGGKYKFTLNDSSIVSAECDATSAISTAETSAYKSTMVQAEIGDCVTSIGWDAFRRCSSLTSVTIGNSVTSIESNAFQYCSSLTSITVEATTPPTLGWLAFHSTNISVIYVPSESIETYKASGWNAYTANFQPIP